MQWHWLEGIERTKRDAVNTQALTIMTTRNRLTNRVATATLLQRYCRNPRQIPERLMYHTGATMGENASKEQRVTTTTQTAVESLTMSTKIALRTESPQLPRSKAIAVIRIECLRDWCIIQVKQWVRRHRKKKNRDTIAVMTTYRFVSEKPNLSTSRRDNSNPTLLESPLFDSCRDDIGFMYPWCFEDIEHQQNMMGAMVTTVVREIEGGSSSASRGNFGLSLIGGNCV